MKISKDLLFINFTTEKDIIYNHYINRAVALSKVLSDYISQNLGKEIQARDIDMEEDIINKMVNNGIFIINENEYHKKKFFIINEKLHMNIVYFHVTQRCNLNCIYCYNKANLNKRDKLSTQRVEKILEDLAQNGIKVINFTGGEALIRNDIVEVVEYAKKLEMGVGLLTNGTLLKEKREILKYVDKCIISLDSINEKINNITRRGGEQYNVNHLWEELTEEERKKITVRSVIVKGQEENISKNKDFFKGKRIGYISNVCLPNSIEELKNIPDLSQFCDGTKPNMCGAGKNIMAIDSDGDIYPCHTFIGIKEYCMGNILHHDWKEKIEEHYEIINATIENREICSECAYKFLCQGGCPNLAYKIYGSIYKSNEFLCEAYKKNAEQYLKNIFERKLKNEKSN